MSSRNQWRLFCLCLALFFAGTYWLITSHQPRDVRLGHYSDENRAVSEALKGLVAGVRDYPAAAAITVHFTGPHKPPKDAEEALSYNNHLGAMMAFVNIPGAPGRWTFSHILCPQMTRAQLAELAADPQRLLQKPKTCGCVVESGAHLMDLLPPPK